MRSDVLDADAASLLTCWFGTADVSGPIAPSSMERWFRNDPAFDATLRERFGALVERASRDELTGWESSAPGALARVLLLDQLPRNLYRSDARAFASDGLARTVADRCLARGFDQRVSTLARAFFYLPFEHGETIASQERAVAAFEALAATAPPALAEAAAAMLRYAHAHRDVIIRFGRFPHRNAALGRESTPEEVAWLQAGGGF